MIRELILDYEAKKKGKLCFHDYVLLEKKIDRLLKNENLDPVPGEPIRRETFRCMIITNFTAEMVKKALRVECFKLGLAPEMVSHEYFGVVSKLGEGSEGGFQPDLIILGLLGEEIFPHIYQNTGNANGADLEEKTREELEQVAALAGMLKDRFKCPLLIHNFHYPFDRLSDPFGANSVFESHAYLNACFHSNIISGKKGIYCLDYNKLVNKAGWDRWKDERQWYLFKQPFHNDRIPSLVHEYMRFIKPLKGKNKKCLVVDLDNTLWGGILGEAGIDGIQLEPQSPGNIFLDFQKYLKELANKGIILAICSKNNESDVDRVFQNHPFMFLKKEDFAATKINWQDKPQNVREISKEIGIGLDSIVFIDDNPREREMMREMAPEVLTVELPEDPALYRAALEGLNDFDALTQTEEDAQRQLHYQAKKSRDSLKESAGSLEGFYKNLKMKVAFKEIQPASFDRICQLVKKTNQYNLTTRRYSEDEIAGFVDRPDYKIYSLKMVDKYGDNGLIGAAIVHIQNGAWWIDVFLLSCRVIGLTLETVFISKLAAEANRCQARKLVGVYIPSPKNGVCQNMYRELGFKHIENREDIQEEIWEYALGKFPDPPDYVQPLQD